jgi:hypothetical protein
MKKTDPRPYTSTHTFHIVSLGTLRVVDADRLATSSLAKST